MSRRSRKNQVASHSPKRDDVFFDIFTIRSFVIPFTPRPTWQIFPEAIRQEWSSPNDTIDTGNQTEAIRRISIFKSFFAVHKLLKTSVLGKFAGMIGGLGGSIPVGKGL